jgi:ABC-type bacteriocin/lantibiotic exporter with double-glycine peptidase domain
MFHTFSNPANRIAGRACLRMILAALGHSVEEKVIAQQCEMTRLGCTVQDLVKGARTLGFNADLLSTSGQSQALQALSNLVPFVAMIDLAELSGGPMFQWHFVVPLFLAADQVTFHDPAQGPGRQTKLDDFLSAWATAGYRGVRVWTP